MTIQGTQMTDDVHAMCLPCNEFVNEDGLNLICRQKIVRAYISTLHVAYDQSKSSAIPTHCLPWTCRQTDCVMIVWSRPPLDAACLPRPPADGSIQNSMVNLNHTLLTVKVGDPWTLSPIEVLNTEMILNYGFEKPLESREDGSWCGTSWIHPFSQHFVAVSLT